MTRALARLGALLVVGAIAAGSAGGVAAQSLAVASADASATPMVVPSPPAVSVQPSPVPFTQPARVPGSKPGMMSVVAKESSTGTYGAPLVDGCSWAIWVARCQNLTVYGNGSSFDDAGCGPPNGCMFGPEFQCTELAQRYAYYAWGEPATWGGYAGANGSAAQMWQAGPALPIPLQQFTQGGGVAPQSGDLLIFAPGWLGSYYDSNGHVAVITTVTSTRVDIVQENGTASGRDTFTLSGTTVTANGYTPIIGWLHNPLMSPNAAGRLTAATASGQQNVFWQGADGHLREAWAVKGTWYGPTDLTATWNGTAPLTSAPSAVISHDGQHQAVYWRSTGGHLWQAVYSNGWSLPVDLSTSWSNDQLLQSAPSAALAPNGMEVIFWEGAGGSLMEAWLVGSTWYGPANIAVGWGSAAPVTSAPTVALSAGGVQFVFWQSVNGHLWEAWYGSTWNGPTDLSKNWTGQGLVASAPSLVITPDGTQAVFWRGTDNHVWEAWFSGTWNGPSDWDTLGVVTSAPTATVTPSGQVAIYWPDAGGNLAQSTWNGSWNGPADISAAWGGTDLLASGPSAGITRDGSTQLTFWRGTNGHLFEAWYTVRWNGPIDLTNRWSGAGILASAPSVAVSPDGSTQLVFWESPDGHLWEAWYTGSWNGPVDWTARWGTGPLGSAPSVWVSPDGRQQTVFWRGIDGHLDEAWFAGSWNGPVDWTARWRSPLLASAPSAVVTPDGGEQLVFWQDEVGHLQEAWFAGSWFGPSDWSSTWSPRATLASSPSVVVTPGGNQLIFWEGTNGHLWETWWAGARSAPVDWATSGNVTDSLGSAPSATLQGGEQLVFWRGPDGHLVESWWGGPWSPPTDISGIGTLA